MAALDLQEQEQLDALKAWWRENRLQLMVVVLIAAISIGGWKGWNYYHAKQGADAASLYEAFSMQVVEADASQVNDALEVIIDKFSSSAYAARASLLAAQVNEQVRNISLAKTQLQWVIDHGGEDRLKDVARLRLAALLLDEKHYAEALQLLQAEHPASFNGLYADLKGDVLSAQGKNEEARSAYRLAIEQTSGQGVYRNLIQMKLDALVAAK